MDETKTVREIVQEGVQETVDLVDEFNQINERFAEPMSDDEMDKLIQRQGEVQDKLDAMDAWDLDARLEMAMDALRCPPGDTPVNVLLTVYPPRREWILRGRQLYSNPSARSITGDARTA